MLAGELLSLGIGFHLGANVAHQVLLTEAALDQGREQAGVHLGGRVLRGAEHGEGHDG